MKDEIIPKKMIITQLEEALEERQKPERRAQKAGLPPEVNSDRRRGDRRTQKK
jgi:hypothetical protein